MTHDNTTHRNLLEVCAGDIESVYAASRGEAQRVELCSALADGGITPSTGFIRQAVRVPGMKVHVLIRPRGGDFLYTPEEVASMTDDIVAAREAGAHGVVIGALTPDGDIDMDACRQMMEAASGMNVTFHRAFDLCRDPFEALDHIIALGCNRLLTSGQAASALDGAPMLRQLVDRAPDARRPCRRRSLPAECRRDYPPFRHMRDSRIGTPHHSQPHDLPQTWGKHGSTRHRRIFT